MPKSLSQCDPLGAPVGDTDLVYVSATASSPKDRKETRLSFVKNAINRALNHLALSWSPAGPPTVVLARTGTAFGNDLIGLLDLQPIFTGFQTADTMEATTRATAVTTLTTALGAEATARTTADNTLGTAVGVLQTVHQGNQEGIFDVTPVDVVAIACEAGTWEIEGAVTLLCSGSLTAGQQVDLRIQINDAPDQVDGAGAFDNRALGSGTYFAGAFGSHRVSAQTGRFIATFTSPKTLYLRAQGRAPGGTLPGTWGHRSVLNATRKV